MQRFLLFSCLIVLIQHDLARVEGIDESDIIPIRVVGRRPNTYDSAKLDRRRSSSRRTGRTDQSGLIDSKCLRCICYASTKCQAFGCDNSGPDSYFCGPFQASWAYWNAGGKPTIQGGLDVSDKHAFEECLKDYECSSRTVEGYMKKHQQDCDNNQVTDCYDFARIHKTGPYSCDSSSIEGQSYWNQFLECMNDEVDVSIPNTGSNTYKEIVPTRRPRPSRRSRQSSRRRAPSTRRPQSRRRPAPVESKLAGRRKTPSRRQTAVASNNLVDEKCLSCICYANTKCEPKACYNAGSAYFCGPFQGTWNFWADGGKPTVRGGLPVDHALSFEECLQDYNCSSRAVEGYMQKHQKDCNNDYVTDCYDFAKIHKAGPYGCTKTEWLERQEYWTRFLDCMDGVARFEVPYDVPAIKPSKDAQQNLPSEDRYTEESSVPDETDQTAVATSTSQAANIDDKCLRCICHASSKCVSKGCNNAGSSYLCGPFLATWLYWSEGGKPTVPGGLSVDHKHAFEECLKDYTCASETVKGYMTKHNKDCNGDNVNNCYDYATMHKAGPYGCPATWLENQSYWKQFLECMNDEIDVAVPYDVPAIKPSKDAQQNLPSEDRYTEESSVPDKTDQTAVATSTGQAANIDDKCLRCICHASSKCVSKGCNNAGSSYLCGPFLATWLYWSEGGKPTVPGGLSVDHKHAFEECLKDYTCASETVKGYMTKHNKDCNGDNVNNCYDYATMHKAGPYGCPATWLENQSYWKQFLECMNDEIDVAVPYDVPAIKPSKDAQQNLPSEDRYTEESSVPDKTDQTAVATSTGQAANIDDKCLRCICHASSKCVSKGCNNAGSSYLCGPFLATWLYWSEGGKPTVPGGLSVDHKHAFEECLKDYTCASETVKGYMTKHNKDCNGDNVNNCYDYATMHKAGPYGCPATWLENQSYWKQFLECMNDEIDVANPGQKIEHQDTNSDGGSNRRRKPSTDDVWHPPPPAGPFEAPVTIRPVSNARLPPFAPKKDQSRNDNKREPTYSEDRPVSNYDEQQPFSGDIVRRNNKRRPPANDDRKQGNSNRRQPIPKDIVDQKCLQCLCYASSKCESLACHNAGPDSYFCGPFQATWAYWKEAGSPTVIGGRTANHKHAFEECLKDYDCAVRSVQGYMNKYQQDCNRDYSVDCYDFARLHRLGGYTCNDTKIESTDYWKQFNDCMDGFVTFE